MQYDGKHTGNHGGEGTDRSHGRRIQALNCQIFKKPTNANVYNANYHDDQQKGDVQRITCFFHRYTADADVVHRKSKSQGDYKIEEGLQQHEQYGVQPFAVRAN